MPTKTIDLSIMYQGQDKALLDVKHEEESLCWLWAFPHLVPWPYPVIWLYTAVTGNKKWPGDLWGVDSQGDLLVVECKQCKRPDDPFVDFKNYHHSGRPELSASHWQEKFQKHLKAELAFPDCLQERPKNKTDGILPRSNQRIHLRRWQTLGGKIDKRIRSPHFCGEASNYLRRREERNDPTPFYLALMVISKTKSPVLTEGAKKSGLALKQMVGDDHVRVITAKGVLLPNAQVRISIEAMPF